MAKELNPIRPTDAESIRLAKTLIRTARFGALAVVDPVDGGPLATRVGVATAMDGSPLILISMLSTHTQALGKVPRCSLLLGEPGKGDPLAYPRISLVCEAEQLDAGTNERENARRRYLSRHPKAQLYAGLGDFHFFRLRISRANLNGGFGKAYHLTGDELVTAGPRDELSALEQSLVQGFSGAEPLFDALRKTLPEGSWRLAGLDPEGLDLMSGDVSRRLFFAAPLSSRADLSHALAALAAEPS